MAISFVRIDDRVIHGQLMTRWAKELPCDGIVAIDDAVAADPLLSQVMKGAVTDVKVWLFDTATAVSKLPKVIASDKKYFVIAKSPVTLRRIREAGISLENLNNKINVGPMSAREGTTTIGGNQCVNQEEISAFNYLSEDGHHIDFRLVPDASSYTWQDAQQKLK
ncbi:PTS system mannose/fructose/N-acetylgalactosamine-transporter subunit IIB [Vibrio barjaei]|jgi:PTS system mannose-specific IIB component|uniref:PTS system mannose/fructose/N-acetylgalactosamine-transporter subunit IIB n=2 Tax=Vibrio TaxID=662 RepID=A0ABW7IPG6_9VIBR|nr:PTS sugar transporter subunit IIB [Vibrio barjaei]MCY9871003.1 PTS sugar transporter subunit IIB [Vibrio barjaei]OIN24332.1 PTS N-acetylgalactosamine transporter subunit IID [Vibrio barjaei]